jgi:hypothetical protein
MLDPDPYRYLSNEYGSETLDFIQAFVQGLSQDIGSVHYAVLGHGLLGAAVPEKERLCGLAAQQADDASLEVLYAAAGTGAVLGCPIKLGAKVGYSTCTVGSSVADPGSGASLLTPG